ncbi:Hypothetical Protein FCC1311_029352 [Hondaea fermentalgiana]|uniref:Uncharacterized protein n=1 Tax=Hondaea fermentalgiana TaxID=2315210 RepID=A0A2R5GFS2_9STRA|nr:Hypothetical Protein FCC1311_029352 [Hondaea fermentalgiana]|eukprot:GBG26714.1 Hypothetical Protein FCC1311_029352 [Hondaea fermentalgiana]
MMRDDALRSAMRCDALRCDAMRMLKQRLRPGAPGICRKILAVKGKATTRGDGLDSEATSSHAAAGRRGRGLPGAIESSRVESEDVQRLQGSAAAQHLGPAF